MSCIAAKYSAGVVDYELTDGIVNAGKFFDFVRGQLITNMQSFPGDRSIIVMDNWYSAPYSTDKGSCGICWCPSSLLTTL